MDKIIDPVLDSIEPIPHRSGEEPIKFHDMTEIDIARCRLRALRSLGESHKDISDNLENAINSGNISPADLQYGAVFNQGTSTP